MWLIIIAVAVGCFLFRKAFKSANFWEKRGVSCSNPTFFVGHVGPTILRKKSFLEMAKLWYEEFPDKRYSGIYRFSKPMLVVRDIDLIKKITVKDFDHFTDHNSVIPGETDPVLGKNLFGLKGDEWRDMRALLSPAFTTSKMRAMSGLISDCARNFVRHFESKGDDLISLDVKDAFTRFANDVIASTAFGVECDSLGDPENQFYKMGKRATQFDGWRLVKFFLYGVFPGLMKALNVAVFPRDVREFFLSVVANTVAARERNGTVRPDVIHLLTEARRGRLHYEQNSEQIKDAGFATTEESHIGRKTSRTSRDISLMDMTAQALIFFFAGFETSSTLMCFLAHELAMNKPVQRRLQNEIDGVLAQNNGTITYEKLLAMRYFDSVVSETLRKWTPGFMLDRQCVKEYIIQPAKSGENPLIVEKGQRILLPIYGIHHDPNYFPNPEKFDPDRFSQENRGEIAIGTFLPFGSGPRNCIGSRFALLETKLLFFYFLSKFDIVPIEKTQNPIKVTPKKLNLQPDDGFWLGFIKRSTPPIN